MSAYGKSANDAYRTVALVTDRRAGIHTCPTCGHTMPDTAPHLTMHRVVSHSGTAPITAIEGN